MRTLADLIAFNQEHCTEEMTYFGQELFELAEATTGLTDPVYRDARRLCLDLTRRHGIDEVMHENHLDAIVAPTYSYGSSAPAVAGYPNISVPTGVTADGRPGGIWMYGRFLSRAEAARVSPTTSSRSSAADRCPGTSGPCLRCRPTPACARSRSQRDGAAPATILQRRTPSGRAFPRL